MKCEECRQLVDDLLSTETLAAQGAEWITHLDQCPSCSQHYALTRQAVMSVLPRVRVEVPTGFKEQIRRAIPET